MKTIAEIKTDILNLNPSRTHTFNGETFEQTEEEFQEAVQKRAEMEYEQQVFLAEQKAKKQTKVSGYQKLGLSNEEIIAIVGLSEDEVTEFLGGN
jgi:hypothetical protein